MLYQFVKGILLEECYIGISRDVDAFSDWIIQGKQIVFFLYTECHWISSDLWNSLKMPIYHHIAQINSGIMWSSISSTESSLLILYSKAAFDTLAVVDD